MISERRSSPIAMTNGAMRSWQLKLWAGVARTWRIVRRFAPARRIGLWVLWHVPVLRDSTLRARRRLREASAYADWICEFDTLRPADTAAIAAHIADLPDRLISVVMPTHNTDPGLLREAIESVRQQLYPHWELCIADDGSTQPHVRTVLEEFADDARIRIVWRSVNGHISAATNSGLALAKGEYVALMDHDDLLAPQALYEVAAELQVRPDTDLIYTDEDKVDESGRRFAPYFKPDWNHDLLLGQNYLNHLSVIRRSLVDRVGGMREGLEGSQDHDLFLRIVELTELERIRHIPAVLYHWRHRANAASFSQASLARCIAAARQAVAEYLGRTGITGARVEPHPVGLPWLRVIWPLRSEPPVSIIVPTRNRPALLAQLAAGILQRTDYANFELLIVDNGSDDANALALLGQLERDGRVRLLHFPGPFNFSAINNFAAKEATGDVIMLLNNDIDVIRGDWLREMVSHAVRPDVGAVGAKLIYPNDTIQHAGVVLGIIGPGVGPGVAGHSSVGLARADIGYFGHNALTRDVSAVTGACLAIRRQVYLSVGGLDEANLPVAFNDVDLCLRIAATGLRNIWTPFAELYHRESASRGSDMTAAKAARFAGECHSMRTRWGAALDNDPFYNPNLSLANSDHVPAEPRRMRPWQNYLPLTPLQAAETSDG
jgi:glycosyltransferase involved in cell wall biosynthesis